MDAPAAQSSGTVSSSQPRSFLGTYYTWLVLTATFSVLAFLLLQGLLDVVNMLNGSSGTYHVPAALSTFTARGRGVSKPAFGWRAR